MKRIRQPDLLDEEPLSKRINNLHLDNQGFSSPNPSPELDRMMGAGTPGNLPSPPHTSASIVYDAYANNNNNNYVKDANLLSEISSQLPLNLMCPNGGSLEESVMYTYQSLHKMIEEREFPDSLSTNYPLSNPTNNNYYYNFNRLLHTLHLERLRRQGKI